MFLQKQLLPALFSLFLMTAAPTMAAQSDENDAARYLPNDVYDRPYSTSENIVDSTMLKRNTGLLFGAGFATMGLLYMMPSSFTNWEDDGESPFSKWWDNVSHAPVWDSDDLFLNYVTHPYAGAIYYMGARSAGVNVWGSALYSFALSTFFWEYGIESFAERPSIQDLIVTPVAGALLGEWFYIKKREIMANNYELCGSRTLGKTAVFLMDPMTEITNLFWANDGADKNYSFTSHPYISPKGKFGYTLSFRYNF